MKKFDMLIERKILNNISIKKDKKNQYLYLRKAIKSKKTIKITWEKLSQMKKVIHLK